MKFRLQRQEVNKKLLDFCAKRIKSDKMDIPRASQKVVKGMPAICEEIRRNGLPGYLVRKKLKGKLGYGIFLHPKARPILKGELIAPYSGEVNICFQSMGNDSNYMFGLFSDLRLSKEEQKMWDPKRPFRPHRLYAIDLDARKKGNFTRFINHSEKPNVEAQLVRMPANGGHLVASPFELVYVAKKTIRPGEQLLVCYEGEGKSYWGPLKIKPFPMTPKTFQLDESCRLIESRSKIRSSVRFFK